jgi:hypothetical protein
MADAAIPEIPSVFGHLKIIPFPCGEVKEEWGDENPAWEKTVTGRFRAIPGNVTA